MRLRILDARVNSLSESAASIVPRCLATEERARALGPVGHHIEVMAKTYRLGHDHWERNEEGILTELVRMAAESENLKPPDKQAAALAYEVLTIWSSHRDHDRSVGFANDWLRVLKDDPGQPASLLRALTRLGACLAHEKTWSLAEEKIRTAILMIPRFRSAEEFGTKTRAIGYYAWVSAMTGNAGRFEADMQRLQAELPTDDKSTRVHILASRGEAWCRRGEWSKGFAFLHEAGMNPDGTVGTWSSAAFTAILVNDTNAWQSLCAFGLANYAGGADPESSRRLVDGLTLRPSELVGNPIIQALIDRALQGAPNTRTEILFSRAWVEFMNGRLSEAEKLLEAHRKSTGPELAMEDLLLRATIRARQGRIAEAREDFKIGATMVSAHFRDRSIPFEGYSWHEGVAFELDRRLAEEAIREADRRGEGR